jgi:hypothetical protein
MMRLSISVKVIVPFAFAWLTAAEAQSSRSRTKADTGRARARSAHHYTHATAENGAAVKLAKSGRISVGPNVLVTNEGDVPHTELHAAANPRDHKNLVGGGITPVAREGGFGFASKAYASRDGGYTWTGVEFPEQRTHGGGDPQVAFSRDGTAIFTALTHRYDPVTSRDRAMLHSWRSTDGGFTWSTPTELGFGYDHEQITADYTRSPYGGRMYLGVLYGYPVYRVGVFRSDDDGRSWIGPAEAANGKGDYGINVANLVVFSDGSLLVPFSDFEFKDDRRRQNPHSNMWFAISKDGGVTFGEPKKVFQQFRGDKDVHGLTTFPVWAADAQGTEYRDRLYLAWTDFKTGKGRILFAMSKDRGATWSEPRMLDANVPADADQYQAEAVVNKDGVLGISWFDTRGASGEFAYNQYFTASLDGGETFLPSKRVSTEASKPGGAGNLRWYAGESRSSGAVQMSTLSAASRWFHGGDYMGLTVDWKGVFHPWWADARSGTFQVYTAAIKVDTGAAKPPAAAARTRADVTESVHLLFDPAYYDPATKTFSVAVRLKNDGQRPIYGPLTVEIYARRPDSSKPPSMKTEIVNASNGKTGDGATFDYATALGDFELLEPGAQTSTVVWRIRVPEPRRGPDFNMRIWGMVAPVQ